MNMRSIKQIFIPAAVMLFLLGIITSCTLNVGSGDGNITETDLQAAGEILGESLSYDNSGVLLSIDDALTIFPGDPQGDAAAKTSTGNPLTQNDRSGSGSETDYSYSYDLKTSVHSVSFIRQVNQTLFSKTVIDSLNYLFKDSEGNLIEYPRENPDHIESLSYNSNREGEIATLQKNSLFVRIDTFLIGGIADRSPILEIDGVHNSHGTMKIEPTNSNNPIERLYELEVNFLNITIKKRPDGEINLQKGVTGTLSWEMTINKRAGETSDSKTMGGTIEMNGDGTALLRFQDLFKRFQVNLNNGDVKDQETEFEGRVQSLNQMEYTVTLINGRTIFLTENTTIDDDDYPSLDAVQQALNSGIEVWAEGEGYVDANQFFAEEIEFEREDESDDSDSENEAVEFEEFVTSADTPANTFTIGGKVVVEITDDTIIDNEGDLLSLQEVANALNNNIVVMADGEALENAEDPGIGLTATEVEFEIEEEQEED